MLMSLTVAGTLLVPVITWNYPRAAQPPSPVWKTVRGKRGSWFRSEFKYPVFTNKLAAHARMNEEIAEYISRWEPLEPEFWRSNKNFKQEIKVQFYIGLSRETIVSVYAETSDHTTEGGMSEYRGITTIKINQGTSALGFHDVFKEGSIDQVIAIVRKNYREQGATDADIWAGGHDLANKLEDLENCVVTPAGITWFGPVGSSAEGWYQAKISSATLKPYLKGIGPCSFFLKSTK